MIISKFRSGLLLALLISFSLPGQAQHQQTVATGEENRSAFISDEAGLLTPQQHAELDQMLREHNQRGPGKIHVCLVERLPAGKLIEQYAYERINQLPQARFEKRDKVLLLAVMSTKGLRIETSAAVWNLLTNDDTRRILRETVRPNFSRGDYYQGLKQGIAQISLDLKTSPKPPVNYAALIWALLRTLLAPLATILLGTILLIILHEAAHAVVALLVGLRVYRVSLGYGRRLAELSLGKVKWEINLLPLGGATHLAPRSTTGMRWRLWLATAAGPGLHLLLALILYYLANHEPYSGLLFCSCKPELRYAMVTLTALNLINLAVNLFPFRSPTPLGMAMSDGYQMMKLPFMTEAELELYRLSEFIHQAAEYRAAGQPEKASATIESALKLYPENRLLRLSLAHYRLNAGEIEWAHAELTALLNTQSSDHAAERRLLLLNNVAYTTALLNRSELLFEAEAYSAEALRAAPGCAAFLGTRGAVLLRLGRVAEGIELLKQSFRQTSDPESRANEACWLALGEALRGNFAEAENWLQKARKGAPRNFLLQQIEQELAAVRAGQATASPLTAAPFATTAQQQVEFTLTEADYFAFSKHNFRKSLSVRASYWVCYLAGIVLLPFTAFGSLAWAFSSVAGFLSLMVVGFALELIYEVVIYWLVRLKVKLMLYRARRSGRLCQQSLTLSPHGLAHNKAGYETHVAWAQVKRVEQSAEHWFLYLRRRAYIIPQRAFGPQQAASSFAHLAVTYWQQAQPKKRCQQLSPASVLSGFVQRQPLAATAALLAVFILALPFKSAPTALARPESAPARGRLYQTDEGVTSMPQLYQQAAALQADGDFSRAESIYKFLTRIEPLNAPGYVGLGSIYYDLGELNEAESNYCYAHYLDPNSTSALIGLSAVLIERDEFTQAENCYQMALRLNPTSIEAHDGLIEAYYRQGKEEQAHQQIKQMAELIRSQP